MHETTQHISIRAGTSAGIGTRFLLTYVKSKTCRAAKCGMFLLGAGIREHRESCSSSGQNQDPRLETK